MKTFNFMKLIAVVAMGVSLSAFGFFGCCNKERCATECAPCPGKACILKPQQVEIVKTCDHPGYYRQICRLEYRPCEGKITRHKACPIFEGCFEEGTNNRLDNPESQVVQAKRNGKRVINGTQVAQPIETITE